MNNLQTINDEIEKLESMPITYSIADKLASLYIIKEHGKIQHNNNVPKLDGSDFLKACSNVDIPSLLLILDDHMNAIRILYPKEYTALLTKINDLK